MVDLHGQYIKIKDEIDQAIQEVINSSSFINGKAVEAFALDLANYTGAKYIIPCANGTDALRIAYQVLDLKPGDEVIMPTFNYVASAEAAALLGLKPVFVDVWEDTFNINENLITERITPATKAIVVVHLFGQSANLKPIIEIAHKFGLKVIEDNAQSLGSDFTFPDGKKLMSGTMGDINTFSFFPTKNLGCFGDGGALSTNDKDFAQKAAVISSHGQAYRYEYKMVGCNSRLDTIQAAILRVKLRKLNLYIQSRIEAGHRYNKFFRDFFPIVTPSESEWSKHTYNQYVIRLAGRDHVRDLLKDLGIPTMIYYPAPMHLQRAYSYLGYKMGDFPVSEKLCHEVLALPIHTELTFEEQEYVANSLIHSINMR